jgi:mannose-6-phosphate isomerase-like protein (cupin superfamily)
MAKELPGVRRVITAIDQEGQSFFADDGPALHTTLAARPGFRHFHVWATGSLPVAADDPDRSAEVSGILPPPGGSVLHILDIPPEPSDPAEREKAYAARRENARAHAAHPTPGVRHYPDGVHPGMHATDSIDYSIVLSGEIYAVLDKEERLLKAGDVLIQRGTSHAWANRSGQVCRIAFMLVHATPPAR